MRRLVVGALLVDDAAAPTRVLAARRATPPAGRWEFPGGKAEPGEGAREALFREISEELLVDVVVHQRLDPPAGGRWPIDDALEMELWWCTTDGEPRPNGSHDAIRWLRAGELAGLDWLPSDLAAIPVLAARLRGPGAGRGDKLRTVPIGERVTVRYRLDGGSATDAVGPVVGRDDRTVVVRTRRRGEVRILLATVIACRVIPG